MAAPKAVWGIDLGQCALKAIKLQYDPKEEKAIAVAFDYVEHPKILSQPDADPEELIKAAYEQFLSRNNVKDDIVYISVPGQAGLSRIVKLPPVETKKIPDIVTFEAKQQIPFPMNEIVWDFQKIGGGEETEGFALETEVAIFAIKKDVVQRTLAPYQRAGIDVEVVQFSPVALHNFATYDYFFQQQKLMDAQAAQSGGEPQAVLEEGEVVVLLDVGADKTDVVVSDGEKIWLRNLPIGGNHFTRALTKELKLTFAKAEHLKRNATKAPDPKRLYQAMRPVFQDFVNELQRSISYYLSTHRGSTIKKIVGVGNGFKLNGMQKFLQQNLQYDVERVEEFRGMRGDEVLAAPTFAENMMSFCVAYGLALQGLKQTPLQTNLMPKEVQVQRLIRQKKPMSLTAATALLLGFCALFMGYWYALSTVSNDRFKSVKGTADSAVTEFKGNEGNWTKGVTELKAAHKSGEELIGADRLTARLGWMKVFRLINDTLVRNTNADVDVEQIEEINIEYIDAEFKTNVGDWYSGLDDFKKQTLSEADKKEGPSGEGWVFQICGYTHNKDHVNFVWEKVLSKFQTEKMKENGITHAIIANYDENGADFNWTPAKGSNLAKIRGSFGQRTSTGAAAGGGSSMPGSGEGGLSSAGGPAGSGGGGGMSAIQGQGGQFGSSPSFGSGGGYAAAMGGGGGRGGMGGGGGPGGRGGGMAAGMSMGEGEGFTEGGGNESLLNLAGDMNDYLQSSAGSATNSVKIIRFEFAIQFVWRPSLDKTLLPDLSPPAPAAGANESNPGASTPPATGTSTPPATGASTPPASGAGAPPAGTPPANGASASPATPPATGATTPPAGTPAAGAPPAAGNPPASGASTPPAAGTPPANPPGKT